MLKDGVALGRPKRILRQATVGFVHGSADLNPFNAAPLGSYAEGGLTEHGPRTDPVACREAARWGWVAARDQKRRLPNARAPRRGGRAAFHPQRARLDRPLPTDRARRALAQGCVVPDRRRGGLLRRQRRVELQP